MAVAMSQAPVGSYDSAGATLSRDGRYRYELTRRWGTSGFGVLWVCLNPSTADALTDDATVRRLVGFSRRWGYTHLTVVNLYAWRSRHPSDLATADDPVGPENDEHIARNLAHYSHELVVAGWGANPGPNPDRPQQVRLAAARYDHLLRCLGKTASGAPRHPLYMPAVARPRCWP